MVLENHNTSSVHLVHFSCLKQIYYFMILIHWTLNDLVVHLHKARVCIQDTWKTMDITCFVIAGYEKAGVDCSKVWLTWPTDYIKKSSLSSTEVCNDWITINSPAGSEHLCTQYRQWNAVPCRNAHSNTSKWSACHSLDVLSRHCLSTKEAPVYIWAFAFQVKTRL